MIRICNIRTYQPTPNEVAFRVDRTSGSPLCNPFRLFRETERDKICDLFAQKFPTYIKRYPLVREELERILEAARTTDVALLCWCAPKRCHAETIKAYLESQLKGEQSCQK